MNTALHDDRWALFLDVLNAVIAAGQMPPAAFAWVRRRPQRSRTQNAAKPYVAGVTSFEPPTINRVSRPFRPHDHYDWRGQNGELL
jgi:hypothetical protein